MKGENTQTHTYKMEETEEMTHIWKVDNEKNSSSSNNSNKRLDQI